MSGPWRRDFDAARDPYTARNALGITGTGGSGGSVDWADITGKPSTFPPTVPIAQSDVTNLLTDLAAKAPLASPTFTGDPKAPTPATADNDTSIATTAFVTAAVAAGGGASVTDPTPPQGRLTLQTAVPVMRTTQSAKTTIFYTPYCGNKIPLYDGANMVMTTFAELSCLTTDTTKNPAAIGASKVNDWFVWNDAGTIRLGHGPDWTNDTTRSAGTALVMVNGIWLNNASITNGPAAQRGTYVGTTRSNASSQLDWIYATPATVAGWFGVWNCYNRVSVASLFGKTGTWTYATATWRAWAGATTIPFLGVFGLAEDAIDVSATIIIDAPSAGGSVWAGISLDSAGNPTNGLGLSSMAGSQSGRSALHARHVSTQLGCHIWYGVEMAAGITFTFRGTADGDGTGMTFIARM